MPNNIAVLTLDEVHRFALGTLEDKGTRGARCIAFNEDIQIPAIK
jgi:hypothetical protein